MSTTQPVKRVLQAKDIAVYVPPDSRVKNANLVTYKFFFHIFSLWVDKYSHGILW